MGGPDAKRGSIRTASPADSAFGAPESSSIRDGDHGGSDLEHSRAGAHAGNIGVPKAHGRHWAKHMWDSTVYMNGPHTCVQTMSVERYGE